jgi:hypothetical protein
LLLPFLGITLDYKPLDLLSPEVAQRLRDAGRELEVA